MADAPSPSDNCPRDRYDFSAAFISNLSLPILACSHHFPTCSRSIIFKFPAQRPTLSMPYPGADGNMYQDSVFAASRSHRPRNLVYPWNQAHVSNASRAPTEAESTGTVPTPPGPFTPSDETWSLFSGTGAATSSRSPASSPPSRSSSGPAQGSLRGPRAPYQPLLPRPQSPSQASVWMRQSTWNSEIRPSSQSTPSEDRFLPPYLRHESTQLVLLPSWVSQTYAITRPKDSVKPTNRTTAEGHKRSEENPKGQPSSASDSTARPILRDGHSDNDSPGSDAWSSDSSGGVPLVSEGSGSDGQSSDSWSSDSSGGVPLVSEGSESDGPSAGTGDAPGDGDAQA
ncbi:uncharacterized protein F5Z01DRAFT_194935 [Emericellopsis atlantica]|uniref:Uncharacterized protein n=1 Tax=Emericellopsis atlantica TaxID=2614577 RepID=A0A9P7ZU69_9HYPO|nr:uncharacterized protein F5Z01DRAFT_194935 [Emericellopsis atlantica]KAG9258384.1 hypothetical protein F5Z01DRAFT_194935 [Emericellopsis atlantica]